MQIKGKKLIVMEMFDGIASRYDFLNHFLSLGIDHLWRKKALLHLKNISNPYILDVASGTGDFAIAALKYNPKKIIGIDLSQEMLKKGEEKIKKRGLDNLIQLQAGDSENLSFQDETFDVVTVAFGVRNFENLNKGLIEMRRVLRKGGKVIILEFSKPKSVFFRTVFNIYFFHILPVLGKLVSRHHKAYSYLPESVDTFPNGREFLDIMLHCGYKNTRAQTLTGGIATIYTGVK
jgi:demethylmenaquinone methyltransferase / 2-methoxy-6-polyprenyl-1,4-benzoquinol methylase